MSRPTIITPALIQEIQELRETGLGTRPIAAQLEISRHTVGKVIRQHLANEPRAPLMVSGGGNL